MTYKYSREKCIHKYQNQPQTYSFTQFIEDLLAKSTKQKSTGKKCEHSWLQDAPIKVCYKCGFKPTIKEKDICVGPMVSHDTMYCLKHKKIEEAPSNNSYNPTQSTLQPIEKVIKFNHDDRFSFLSYQGGVVLADKINELIDRINLLSEGREI